MDPTNKTKPTANTDQCIHIKLSGLLSAKQKIIVKYRK